MTAVPSALTGAPAPAGPVPPDERIEVLDTIRGLALAAVIVVNWTVDLPWPVQPWAGFTGFGDQTAFWTVQLFLKDKAWPVFAFLFGLGFALQLGRAEARGRRFGPFHVRRLAILFLIGAVHYVLTDRDIVHMYAVLGLLLLPLRRVPSRLLPPLALGCVLALWAGGAVRDFVRAPQPAAAPAERRERVRAMVASSVYRRGSFAEITRLRARALWRTLTNWKTYVVWLGDPFPPFLLGLYVGRRGVPTRLTTERPWLRRVLVWALGIGVAGTVACAALAYGTIVRGETLPFAIRQLALLAERIGGPALGLAYAAGLALLLQHPAWRRRLGVFAPYGRMALTHYLLQSVAFVLVFFGYGLGWFGTVGAAGTLALAVPVVALGVVVSRRWLRRFRFGPAEWLWRSLAYGAPQAWRGAAAGLPGR